eukprot:1289123-Rhodomonas_salina.3
MVCSLAARLTSEARPVLVSQARCLSGGSERSGPVVVYTMLCGCPPFYGDDNAAIYKSIESGVYEWPEDVEVSQEAKDFIGKLLTLDPQERITAHDALQ